MKKLEKLWKQFKLYIPYVFGTFVGGFMARTFSDSFDLAFSIASAFVAYWLIKWSQS